MPVIIKGRTYYRTTEVCRMVGICRNTLFRWLKEGKATEVEYRDYRGWRLFTRAQIDAMRKKITDISAVHNGDGGERSEASQGRVEYRLPEDQL